MRSHARTSRVRRLPSFARKGGGLRPLDDATAR